MESEKKLVKDINIRWFDNEIVIEPASGKHEITFIWFHHIYKNAIDPASFLIRGPTLQFEVNSSYTPTFLTRPLER